MKRALVAAVGAVAFLGAGSARHPEQKGRGKHQGKTEQARLDGYDYAWVDTCKSVSMRFTSPWFADRRTT